jgi:hypothetical protein
MQVIMIARLHAMYQRSRKMLNFLILTFLAVNIACVVYAAIALVNYAGGKPYSLIWRTQFIGQTSEDSDRRVYIMVHHCSGSTNFGLPVMIWWLNTVWEVLALCLSVWIAVKHFRDLRRLGPLTGSTIGDCFRVLIKSHVLYFARWACNWERDYLFLLKFCMC